MRRTLGLALALGAVLASGASCTHDFGAFEGGASGAKAGRSGSSGEGGDGGSDSGSGGSGQGGSGDAGTSGSGGAAGSGGSPGGAGGQTPDGGDAGGAPATGGGGAGGAAGDSGTGGVAGACSSSQKLCGASCVSLDDPTKGCAAAGCTACSYPNAAAICSVGACAQGACSSGFGDCDTSAAAPGCERPVHDDIANCGGCNRACASTNVATAACTGNECTSFCAPGFGNCSRPKTGVDNGCETDVLTNTANCGGCLNNCGSQRNKICRAGKCACDAQRDCSESNNTTNVACDTTSGLCSCSGVPCVTGETCIPGGAECRCNGGAKCGAGQTCCQTPAGCFDLQTDAENCGGCGNACTPGHACVAGACQ